MGSRSLVQIAMYRGATAWLGVPSAVKAIRSTGPSGSLQQLMYLIIRVSCILRRFRMTYNLKCIRLCVVARVAWIEFNRAPVNAFNREMVEEVREAIAASLADPEVRVVVIASAIDNYFSAGADLHVFEGMKAGDMHSWISLCHEIARLLSFLSQASVSGDQRNRGRRRSRDGAPLRPPVCGV